MTNKATLSFLSVGFIAVSVVAINAQNATPNPDDEPDFIVPARPTVSNPAQFQRPGVLQLEIGYVANFSSRGSYNFQQDVPVALRFAVNKRLLLELDSDSPYALKNPFGRTETRGGDTQVGIQAVLQKENEKRPGIAFAYYIKLPTADARRGLGTGRVDHIFIGLVSKTVKKTTVDLNAIYLLAGNTTDRGHSSSGQAAVAVTQNLTKRFGVQGEVSGFGRNNRQPGAIIGLGVATYKINRRAVLDGGIRIGITRGTPRAGVVAGITFGIANLYKKHH
jgi:hypothetical protein